jgi:hypothetical protein
LDLDKEDVEEAVKGMECEIDKEFIARRKVTLKKQLEALEVLDEN